MPKPTFIENDTDPGNFGEGCTITANDLAFTAVAPREWPQTGCISPDLHNPRRARWGNECPTLSSGQPRHARVSSPAGLQARSSGSVQARSSMPPLSWRIWTCRVISTVHDSCVPIPFVYNEPTLMTAYPTALHHPGEEK